MKISHSAVEEYEFCSEKYNLNRVQKIRPVKNPSTFVFGKAMDEALNEVLSTKLEVPKKDTNPWKVFQDNWQTVSINGVDHILKNCLLIEYSKKDLDINLFIKEDYDLIRAEYPELDVELLAIEIQAKVDFLKWNELYIKLSPQDIVYFNFLCWVSLARKGKMMIDAYEKEFMPQVRRVLAIQKPTLLVNDEGDTVNGFLDFIVEMDDGKIYIGDNKTTSDFKYYKMPKPEKKQLGCVKESNQLTGYGFAEDIPNGLYAVLLKTIEGTKKDPTPTVKFRLIKDEFDPIHTNNVLHKYNVTCKKIKAKEFNKKEHESYCFEYGKTCAYAGYCWRNSMEGLVKK